LTVVNDAPPSPQILTPEIGLKHNAGDTIEFSGTATDPEDGAFPASAFTWQIDFHHDEHVHPAFPSTSGITSGSYAIQDAGHTDSNVWFRVYLSVKDSAGTTVTIIRDVHPNKAQIRLETEPPGLTFTLDSSPVATPYEFTGIVGMVRILGAVSPQSKDGIENTFSAWSNSGDAIHAITTPDSDSVDIAVFSEDPCATTQAAAFVRGNVDMSVVPLADPVASITLFDGVSILQNLFQGVSTLTCEDAADANDDGRLNLLDAMIVFQFLIGNLGPELPAPFTSIAPDATSDALGCAGTSSVSGC